MRVGDAVKITEEDGFSLVSILARRGASPASIGDALSIEMPDGPRWSAGPAMVVIGAGPGTWLARRSDSASAWREDLEHRLAGLAGVSDQTGAYRLFRIEGPQARTLLQRGVAIDLDDSAFATGAVAITVIAYIDVILRRLDGDGAYELWVYRSYADSFLAWLDSAVAGL